MGYDEEDIRLTAKLLAEERGVSQDSILDDLYQRIEETRARLLSEDGKSYKIVGIDKFDEDNWTVETHEDMQEAMWRAQMLTQLAKVLSLDSSIATVYYAYDPEGNYLAGDEPWEGQPPETPAIPFMIENSIFDVRMDSITRDSAEVLVVPANTSFYEGFDLSGVRGNIGTASGGGLFLEGPKKEARKKYASDSDIYPIGSSVIIDGGRLNKKLLNLVATDYITLSDNSAVPKLPYATQDQVQTAARSALETTREQGHASIAFPALGTRQLGGLPLEQSVRAIYTAADEHIKQGTTIERIGMVLYGPANFYAGLQALK